MGLADVAIPFAGECCCEGLLKSAEVEELPNGLPDDCGSDRSEDGVAGDCSSGFWTGFTGGAGGNSRRT